MRARASKPSSLYRTEDAPLVTGGTARLARYEAAGPAGAVAAFVRWAVTLNVVCLTWVFFRAKTFGGAGTVLTGMAGLAAKPEPLIAGGPMIIVGTGFIVWVLTRKSSLFP